MAFDINGFGGGFSGFDSGKVRAEGGGGLEDTALNAQIISGKFASDSLAGYGNMLQAKEMAKAYKEQAKAKQGGLGGFLSAAAPLVGAGLGALFPGGSSVGKIAGSAVGNVLKGLG